MSNSQYITKYFLLVDDHTLIRSALKLLINETYPDSIIEESIDTTDVIEKLAVTDYDLIIMDIHMPNSNILWLTSHIHLNCRDVPVLIYSMSAENIYAFRVLKAGAKGFISKEAPIEEVKKAIDTALQGKIYYSKTIIELISDQTFKKTNNPFSSLSAREVEIVELLLAGNTVTDISRILLLCNSTVCTHKTRVYQKLKVANVLELKEISDVYHF